MAESTAIADFFVELGVQADANAIPLLERFDAVLQGLSKRVDKFAAVASAGSASFAALGASAANLAPLITSLDEVISRLNAMNAAQAQTKPLPAATTAAGAASSTGTNAAVDAATKQAEAEEKARQKAEARLETLGASASASEKAALAYKREREEILAAAAATGNNDAALKALNASEERYNATLAKIAKQEEDAKAKAQERLETIGASTSASERAALAYKREKEEIQRLAAASGDEVAAQKAMAAAEERHAAALVDLARAEQGAGPANLIEGFSLFGDAIEATTAAMLAAVGAVAALGAALADTAVDVANDTLAAERQAAVIGATTQEYEKLAYVLGRFGVDTRDIADFYGQFSQQIEAAAQGSKTAVEMFQKLGLSVEDLKTMTPEEQLKALADALANVENPTERLALASSLLGEDLAKKMVPLLVQGSGAIEDLAKQAEELGLVLSDEDVEAAHKLTSEVAELEGIAEGLRLQLGTGLMPVLIELAERFSAWYEANAEVIGQQLDKFVSDATVAFEAFGQAVTDVSRIFGGFSGAVDFAEKMANLAFQVWEVAAALGALAAGPMLAFLSALATAALAVQDLWIYLQGGDSVIGLLIERFGQTDTLLGAVIRTIQALAAVGSAAFNLLSVAFQSAWTAAAPFRDLLSAIATLAGGAVLSAVQTLANALTGLLNTITPVLTGLAGILGSQGAVNSASLLGSTAATASPGVQIASAIMGPSLAPSTAIPTAAPTAPATVTVTIGGATINGLGMTPEQAQQMLDSHTDTQQRAIQQALLGVSQ